MDEANGRPSGDRFAAIVAEANDRIGIAGARRDPDRIGVKP